MRRLDLKPTSREAQHGWGLALYSLPDIIFHGGPAAQIAVAEVSYRPQSLTEAGCAADPA